ncbi:hypothetical protein E3T26_15485 [Cryobacterium sp. TMT1-21]|uniref:Uncharacterized protein n=1 Tax=Cryobacterium shii TaxID=1259235 RepID=A0AAQ2C3X9_9MICO|nr:MULTISPECIES: hypothetical protein [Cryobacterium]TFC41819.1 hypothetical protein E3O49_15695 [Cryobacterium shii]TFC88082.1 hypothetical protein E3T24_03815 [Cryobacterium sp. TmT2-59]TFD08616.1 hypothetical protein E3T26_15485 [Cryobacterium sp. TMT1-21]TFD14819.1 hypothetical protein E3T42_11295 [Cryobacterium sp. TMT4-10]TFD20029.1 hypothetical protein E3T32_09600 [Cryobacterium sp. TMT2-23]
MFGSDGTFISDSGLPARLAELRERRMLLRALRDDVEIAARSLAPTDLTGSWRSAAQRGYAERRSELAGELHRAARHLEDALAAVAAEIEEVQVVLAAASTRTPGAP